MARLHEYQGKAILAANGFKIPRGRAAATADEAMAIAREFDSEVVIKIQAWTTGRAGIGGVAFARKPADVRGHAARMLAMKVGQFPVEAVLVEEKIAIEREFFLSFAIDDAARAPVIIFAAGGGSGIEERAASTKRIACDVKAGPMEQSVTEAVSSCGLAKEQAAQLADSIRKLFSAARSVEARSLEINPLVLTKAGDFVAADCRITIDDYAVARHPELKIEIAREFDHPPTELERVAYAVEQSDHRGTFYFAQLATSAAKDSKGLVGFHGAGGGGSMMSMDAIVNAGFTIANFTDTSGNPSASKVYRASSHYFGAARPHRIFRFGLRRRKPGTILVGVRTGQSVLGTRSRYSRGDSFRRKHRRSRGRDFATHVQTPARANRGLSQNRCASHDRDAVRRTRRERKGNKMETARSACAEVRAGSIGHQASSERRSRVDRQNEMVGDSPRGRNTFRRIDRRSR